MIDDKVDPIQNNPGPILKVSDADSLVKVSLTLSVFVIKISTRTILVVRNLLQPDL